MSKNKLILTDELLEEWGFYDIWELIDKCGVEDDFEGDQKQEYGWVTRTFKEPNSDRFWTNSYLLQRGDFCKYEASEFTLVEKCYIIEETYVEKSEKPHSYKPKSDIGELSDGFHTFNELYNHRHHLFIALMLSRKNEAWISKKHDDGTMFDNFFIAGLKLSTGIITYHLPLSFWKVVRDKIQILDNAPKWDGHTSNDVINRLAQDF